MSLSGCSDIKSALELVQNVRGVNTCKTFISSDPRLEQIETCCKQLTYLSEKVSEITIVVLHLQVSLNESPKTSKLFGSAKGPVSEGDR